MIRKNKIWIKRVAWVLSAVVVLNVCLSGSIFAMEAETEMEISTPGNTEIKEEEHPAESLEPTESPEQTQPLESIEPPETTKSSELPESQKPQKPTESLVRMDPDQIPDWYTMISGRDGRYWTFVDRWGKKQYRIYGSYGDHPDGWMTCDAYGEMDEYSYIDIDEEDQILAPYRYESISVEGEVWNELQQASGMDPEAYQKEIRDPYMGQNYDGTNYDIWWLSKDLEDITVHSSTRAAHTVQTVLWHLGCPSLASSYKYQSVTAQCGDRINFVVHEYRYSSSTYDTPMDQGDSDLSITGRFIYNGKSGANWKQLCGINGRAPGSASIVVRADSAGTWYAGHTYTDWDSEGSESGVRKSGQITIRVSGHNYNYKITPVIAASCTEEGSNKKACACGLSTEEVVPALGHNEPESYDTSADNGTYFKDCIRCEQRLETYNNPYTVRFDSNHGEGMVEDLKMTYGIQNLLPAGGFARTGYILAGWNTSQDGTEESYTLGESVGNLTPVYEEVLTLYAFWKPIVYNAVFNATSGTGGGSITTGYEQKMGALPKAEKTGHRFLGWFTEETGGKPVTADTLMPLGGATCYAQWEICQYPISWQCHGGSGVESWIRDYDTELGLLPDTDRAGYLFKGWHKAAVSDAETVTESTRVPVDGAKYHAHWKAIRYPIHWNSHGGNGVPSWLREYETELGSLPDTKRAGYSFEGWHTGTDIDARPVTEETEVPLHGATFHARWKAIPYPIGWDSHGGSPVESWSRDYDTELGSLPDTKRAGYTFAGWYIDSAPDAKAVREVTKVPLNGAVYHARWKAIKYPVTWYSNGGTVVDLWSRDYDTRLGALPDTERRGYTFKGWHRSTSSDAARVTGNTRVPLDGMDCYAWWQVNQYRIAWDSHGGTAVEAWERDYDTRLGRLPSTERSGYILEGWYTGTSSDAGKITEETPMPLGGATFHAWWKAIRYPITWDSRGGENVDLWSRDYETELGELPEPGMEGYTLQGWKTATSSDAEYITKETTVPIHGATYYADWKAIDYPVIWNSMGGVLDFGWSQAYDTEVGQLPVPVRYGYRFKGWYTSETFQEPVTEDYRVPLGGARLYAKWERANDRWGTTVKKHLPGLVMEVVPEPEPLQLPATVHAYHKQTNDLVSTAIGDFTAVIKEEGLENSRRVIGVTAKKDRIHSKPNISKAAIDQDDSIHQLDPFEQMIVRMVMGILIVAGTIIWVLWIVFLSGRREE